MNMRFRLCFICGIFQSFICFSKPQIDSLASANEKWFIEISGGYNIQWAERGITKYRNSDIIEKDFVWTKNLFHKVYEDFAFSLGYKVSPKNKFGAEFHYTHFGSVVIFNLKGITFDDYFRGGAIFFRHYFEASSKHNFFLGASLRIDDLYKNRHIDINTWTLKETVYNNTLISYLGISAGYNIRLGKKWDSWIGTATYIPILSSIESNSFDTMTGNILYTTVSKFFFSNISLGVKYNL